jgi:hypothetical protein
MALTSEINHAKICAQGHMPNLIRLYRYARIGMPTEQAGPLPGCHTERCPRLNIRIVTLYGIPSNRTLLRVVG